MPFAQATAVATEQQFESQVRAAVLKAFSWLPGDQIEEQLTFTFRAGHHEITVNKEPKTSFGARLDILVKFRGEPLAVFELKREGEKLAPNDAEQALSYARMMFPHPPLVILTNGDKTLTYETYTGAPWKPETPSEDALAVLVERTATVAKADLKRAIETLMGGEPMVWMDAVRQTSKAVLDEMTGDWGDPSVTFVDGWGLERTATQIVVEHLQDGARLVVVEGAPLAGKSHVLRDLVDDVHGSDLFAALYVQADSGADLFQQLADLLSRSLDWPLTRDEARSWLTTRARTQGPALVLVLDHVGRGDADLRRDIEALTSNAFGPGVRVVLAADDSAVDAMLKKAVGRGPGALAPRVKRVAVGPLSDDEFFAASNRLHFRRVEFLPGARHSSELRHPWVLHAMVGDVHAAPKYRDLSLAAALPPQPGLGLLHKVREDFDGQGPPISLFRELAQSLLGDLEGGTDSAHALRLQGGYVVRRDTAIDVLSAEGATELLQAGLIVPTRINAGENVFSIRLPQLLASEMAKLLGERIADASPSAAFETADWLLDVTSGMVLGDTIAAQALIDAATRRGNLSVELIHAMVNRPPTKEVLAIGSKLGGWMEGAGAFTMTLLDAGAVKFEMDGMSMIAEADPDGPAEHVAWKDTQPWMILSRLAGYPFEIVNGDETFGRGDVALLLHVGSCPIPLVEPGGDMDLRSLPVHDLGDDLTIVCHRAGLVEPITWSLFDFLSRSWRVGGEIFVGEALELGSAALLARLDLCLRVIAGLEDAERRKWAVAARARVTLALGLKEPTVVHD